MLESIILRPIYSTLKMDKAILIFIIAFYITMTPMLNPILKFC